MAGTRCPPWPGDDAVIWAIALLLVGFVSVPRRNVARRRRPKARTPKAARPSLDMGAIVTEVATRLRSGSTPERAWSQTLEHAGLPVTDLVLDADGVPLALRQLEHMRWRERRRVGVNDVVLHTLPATYAVCMMSFRTGAPMAEVLEACAAGITESGEAKSAREVALAGPQTSARMLAVLPIFGLLLGFALGADPLCFLFTTPLGHLTLAAGVAFEAVGVVWTRRMVARARVEEE
ncbi:type II secretion system F family protein [Trueperella pyogenes]